jgi:carbon-monoxide dehydrogenase medium subunit
VNVVFTIEWSVRRVKFIPAAGFIATSFRTLPRFKAVRAATIAEALSALNDAENPAVLAGGTDLPARFNEGFAPSDLIDISGIDALRQVRMAENTIEIGATVAHADGCVHPLIAQHLPSLAGPWSRIANVRIRFSATLGGNLMARRTRYEGAILLTALGARMRLRWAAGEMEIPVEDIWTADLPRAVLLTTVVIPLRRGLRLDYARELRPIMTQAVALEDDAPGRVVTATEYVIPRLRRLESADPISMEGEIGFDDPVTSAAYLARVSRTLLERQLKRMSAP